MTHLNKDFVTRTEKITYTLELKQWFEYTLHPFVVENLRPSQSGRHRLISQYDILGHHEWRI